MHLRPTQNRCLSSAADSCTRQDCGYRLLFACPSGLVEHLPTQSQPFPPEYEMGYNVLAYVPDAHRQRVQAAEHLRAASGPQLLPMDPPPRPNRIE